MGEGESGRMRALAREYWRRAVTADNLDQRIANAVIAAYYLDRAHYLDRGEAAQRRLCRSRSSAGGASERVVVLPRAEGG